MPQYFNTAVINGVYADILVEGFKVSGDVRSGYHATVPYLCRWQDADLLTQGLVGAAKTLHIGPISWTVPYQYPGLIGGRQRPIYCQSFEIVPCGAGGTLGSTGGLSPGEFYQFAKVTAQFDSLSFLSQVSDDPNSLNQLDPSNPITACEQTCDIIGQLVTVKGRRFEYGTSSFSTSGTWAGTPVPIDRALLRNQVRITAKFPRVPYLPWQLIQPYVGKVNNAPLFACVKGSMMLEGWGTVLTPMTDGSLGQAVTLKWAFNPDWTGNTINGMDFNCMDYPDGSGYAIVGDRAGTGMRPYQYVNFALIFASLSF